MDPVTSDPKPGSSSSGPSDGQLVSDVLSGNRRAFDELIGKYQRQAVAVSYRLLGNSQDALEVTQDAFLKAFTSLETLQKPEAFGGWLMRIVSNLSLNYRRSRKTRNTVPLAEVLAPQSTEQTDAHGASSEWMSSASGDPVRRLQGRELGEKLKWALSQLPEKQRLAIVMFTIDEMPQKQIAEALNSSVEAIKWHVFQGRKRLKELLKDEL
jgi:RNA polymerase sigma-70 factor (ECF subfamily)